ncbi:MULTISPECIES: YhjD/YihY/BrkB family envelope integrity protein [unclassified Acinetobacter]|uniref:YihY family inner membrane protein n=1 Tax=unclassified Acinetobacter TaxID=196816 RepID=UPI0035B98637
MKWLQFMIFLVKRFEKDRCREMAGSLTYTTLFAIVPTLTVFLVIVSSIKALEPARQQMQNWIYSNLLPRTSIAFEKTFNSFAENSTNLTAIGILFLFVTVVMMISTIEDAFNRIWRVKKSRGGLSGFMRYWTIISLGPILLGTAFVLSSAVASMNLLQNNVAGYEFNFGFILSVLSFVLTCVGISLLYWAIPNRAVPIRSAAIAGIFTAIIFTGLKHFFGYIMSNFTSYELVYGAFAAVPIFLLWIYINWIIVLFGVELSFALTAYDSKPASPRHPIMMLMDILELFYHKQKQGKGISEKDALDLLGRDEIGRWPHYVELLQEQKIIGVIDNDQYMLIRNLNYVDFWEFYHTLPFQLPHHNELDPYRDDVWVMRFQYLLKDADEQLQRRLSVPIARIFENNR